MLGITSNVATYRRLALTWGVEPALIGAVSDTDSMVQRVVERVVEMGRVREGDRVVITSGSPINNPGSTNLIKVHTIGQPLHAIS